MRQPAIFGDLRDALNAELCRDASLIARRSEARGVQVVGAEPRDIDGAGLEDVRVRDDRLL